MGVRRLGNSAVGLTEGVGQLAEVSGTAITHDTSSEIGFGSWALDTFTCIRAVSRPRYWAIIELTSARARLIN